MEQVALFIYQTQLGKSWVMGELGDSAGRELQGKVVSCDWPWKERVGKVNPQADGLGISIQSRENQTRERTPEKKP